MTNPVIRIALVNDSSTTRLALRRALNSFDDLEVVLELNDAIGAEQALAEQRPDVVIMDVVMPGIDGFEATRRVLATLTVPIILMSSQVDPKEARNVFQALAAGAVCITSVPSLSGPPQMNTELLAIAQLIRGVARARPRSFTPAKLPRRDDVDLSTSRIEAVGIVASAGGPGVLAQLLVKLPVSFPPVLLVQHISPGFAENFAHWLSEETGTDVRLAVEGAQLERGCTYVAPDDVHLTTDSLARIRLVKDGPAGPFRPSGDALLTSLSQVMGSRALGVILTGMGRDGTAGALEMRRRGGRVITQDRHSSVVYGMPKAALESGAAEAALSLNGIAKWLVQRCLEV